MFAINETLTYMTDAYSYSCMIMQKLLVKSICMHNYIVLKLHEND